MTETSAGGDASGAGGQTPAVSIADVSDFCKYVRKIIPCLLDENDESCEQLDNALKDKNNLEIIKKYISDPQIPALLVQRLSQKGMFLDSFFYNSIRFFKK